MVLFAVDLSPGRLINALPYSGNRLFKVTSEGPPWVVVPCPVPCWTKWGQMGHIEEQRPRADMDRVDSSDPTKSSFKETSVVMVSAELFGVEGTPKERLPRMAAAQRMRNTDKHLYSTGTSRSAFRWKNV